MVRRAITIHVGTVLVLTAAAAAIATHTPLVSWLPTVAGAPTLLVLLEFSPLCGGVGALVSALEFRRMPRSQLVVQFILGLAMLVGCGGMNRCGWESPDLRRMPASRAAIGCSARALVAATERERSLVRRAWCAGRNCPYETPPRLVALMFHRNRLHAGMFGSQSNRTERNRES